MNEIAEQIVELANENNMRPLELLQMYQESLAKEEKQCPEN